MKVAFVSYDFGQYCIRHANELAQECEVLLLLRESVAAAHRAEISPAVRCYLFDAPRLRQPWRQMRTTYSLFRAIAAFAPDVIHFQRGHLWFNLGLPLLKRYPLVVTMHDVRHHPGDAPAQNTPQAILNIAYRRADQIIVHGEWLKQAAVRELGLAEDRIHIIPHIAIGPPASALPQAEEENLILFFGRIWPYKGLEHLIRAEPLVTAAVPEARIAIAGAGEPFARYRRMMVHPDRFLVYNHWISDTLQAELFHRASVVVLPYIEASQSGVIPCAYSCAKPVIATRTGSLPEMVEHGRTGYLVPPGDERALADAMIDLLQNKGRRRWMGDNGQRLLQAVCSPAAVVSKTMGVYQQAIAARLNGGGRR
jgi:glycosyltransferase involved in cell wall biosynthesis